jgi:hypothetical protein
MALIEELLDYSKIEAGKLDLDQRPFALSTMIEEITELLAPRAQAKTLEIAAYVDERLPLEVVGDAARLRQVLLNLAGNAIKFTATGGVALIVEPGIWPNEISFWCATPASASPRGANAHLPRVRAGRRARRPHLWRHRARPCHQRAHRQAHGRPHHPESEPGRARPSKCRFRSRHPQAGAGRRRSEPRPHRQVDHADAPQSIEASLIARRLQRWGGQTCLVSDARWRRRCCRSALARRAGRSRARAAKSRRLGEARARMRRSGSCCSRRRRGTSTCRSAFTGYLIKPLRAARSRRASR